MEQTSCSEENETDNTFTAHLKKTFEHNPTRTIISDLKDRYFITS